MSRVPRRRPAELDAEQTALYQAITTGPRAAGPQHFRLTGDQGELLGPFDAFLLSPRVGAAVQELGAAIRYRSGLSPRIRELAILVVAAHWSSAFERAAHESVGRATGLDEAELAAVRDGAEVGATDEERQAVRVCRALLAGDLDDGQWAAAREVLGEATIFELTTVVGYYAMLALQLRVFRRDEV